MAFEGFPNRGNASATPRSEKRPRRRYKTFDEVSADAVSYPDSNDDANGVRWVPLVLLLLAVLPTLTVLFFVADALLLR